MISLGDNPGDSDEAFSMALEYALSQLSTEELIILAQQINAAQEAGLKGIHVMLPKWLIGQMEE